MVRGQISHGSREIREGKSEVACARTRKSKNRKFRRKFLSDLFIIIINFGGRILKKFIPNDAENPLRNACQKNGAKHSPRSGLFIKCLGPDFGFQNPPKSSSFDHIRGMVSVCVN